MPSPDANRQEPTVAITETALAQVLRHLQGAPAPERLGMWVEITGAGETDWLYSMSLRSVDAAGAGDSVQEWGGLTIVVRARDVDKVRGAVIDWVGGDADGGLMMLNPNKPPPPLPALPTLPTLPMAGGPAPAPSASPAIPAAPVGDLTGDVAQRVMTVLQRQINPAIAAHGGRAELVAVEDGTAYLRLGGGCQGCGMATVTLSQGIEVAITDAVPEVTRVVDVTDHASGTNPYFQAAKK